MSVRMTTTGAALQGDETREANWEYEQEDDASGKRRQGVNVEDEEQKEHDPKSAQVGQGYLSPDGEARHRREFHRSST